MSTLHEVPVPGGALTVGEWGPAGAPVALAVHGISGTHMSWNTLARMAAERDIRLIAPDLRGRGRSTDLPGPYGMGAHAEDLAAVLDHFRVDRATVIGHSMGAFVALVFAHLHPGRAHRGVLVDGGLPLPPPPGSTPEDLSAAILRPIEVRLANPVSSREGYRAAWKVHPAFEGLTGDLFEYIDYDLLERDGRLWASGNFEAIRYDGQTLGSDPDLLEALNARADGTGAAAAPMRFLRAEAGMAVGAPPLYPREAAEDLGADYGVPVSSIDGVNHYTIVMSEAGSKAIVGHLLE